MIELAKKLGWVRLVPEFLKAKSFRLDGFVCTVILDKVASYDPQSVRN